MVERNLAAITDKEWKAFLKDVEAVQTKHKMLLVPTISLEISPITGIQPGPVKWGVIRQPENDVPKANSK